MHIPIGPLGVSCMLCSKRATVEHHLRARTADIRFLGIHLCETHWRAWRDVTWSIPTKHRKHVIQQFILTARRYSGLEDDHLLITATGVLRRQITTLFGFLWEKLQEMKGQRPRQKESSVQIILNHFTTIRAQ